MNAEVERIGAQMSRCDQAFQEWLAGAQQIALRAGAIDDEACVDRLEMIAVAGTEVGGDVVALRRYRLEFARDDAQSPAVAKAGDLFGDLGREAMAVNVPPGAQVVQEAALFLGRGGEPHRLRVGAQFVDRGAPADVARTGADAVNEGGAEFGRLFGQRRLWRIAMRVGAESASREGHDRAAKTLGVEREDHVDHRETRADDQDGIVVGETIGDAGAPRITGVEIGRQIGVAEAGRIVRGQVAEREDGGVGGERAAICEGDRDAIGSHIQRYRLVLPQGQPPRIGAEFGGQQFGEIVAIVAA